MILPHINPCLTPPQGDWTVDQIEEQETVRQVGNEFVLTVAYPKTLNYLESRLLGYGTTGYIESRAIRVNDVNG